MEKQIKKFAAQIKRQDIPDIKTGDTVRVHQKYTDKGKEKIQIFEGLVLCRKHGKETGAAITVRKIASGVGVEKIFPVHSPMIAKIEVVKSGKVRRAKIYYIREAKGRKSRLKRTERKIKTISEELPDEGPINDNEPEAIPEAANNEPEIETEEKSQKQEA
jgi:large subunit ribosomal protein L19